MKQSTLFISLGLTIRSVDCGVYQLERRNEGGGRALEYLGMLVADAPLTAGSSALKFFVQEVPDGVAAQRMAQHWKTLDAHRFEQSGMEPILVPLSEFQVPADIAIQKVPRPDGSGDILHVTLVSGEIVRYT